MASGRRSPVQFFIVATGVAALAVVSACAGEFTAPDATPVPDLATVFACKSVDLLFVVDNSNSMEQEQKNLVANFPAFIQRIEAIQPALRSYHVGVISTDIGAGAHTIGTCSPPGDEGRLQHQGRVGACAGKTFPRFLEGPSPTLAADFGCIAELGLQGCGFEQQLESALVALTAQPENDGFLRANAPLAIIFITDEDDCSAWDTSLYDPNQAALGDLKTRCVRLAEKLHPLSRYVDGLRRLKDDPRRVVVAVVSGPRGEIRFDSSYPDTIAPACSSAALGDANPGNRFADLIAAFGAQGIHHSICQGDLAPALDLVAGAIEQVCLD